MEEEDTRHDEEDPMRRRRLRKGIAQIEDDAERPTRGQNEAIQPAVVNQTSENSDIQLGARRKEINGSYHCPYHKRSVKCDLCGHMDETRNVFFNTLWKKALSGWTQCSLSSQPEG